MRKHSQLVRYPDCAVRGVMKTEKLEDTPSDSYSTPFE